MITFLEALSLLLTGFVVGLFSPLRMGVRVNRVRRKDPIKEFEEKAEMMITHFEKMGEGELAKLARRLKDGQINGAQLLDEMSPEMRKRYDKWTKTRKENK